MYSLWQDLSHHTIIFFYLDLELTLNVAILRCHKNEHSFEICHLAWSSKLSCKISRRCDQPFSSKWRLKLLFLVVFRIFPNWNCYFRSGLWKAGCDVVRLYVLQIYRSCSYSINFSVFKINWNCNYVDLLHHPFWLRLVLALFGQYFSTFDTACLAKDHWRGFSTRNAHMVHIVNLIRLKMVYTS